MSPWEKFWFWLPVFEIQIFFCLLQFIEIGVIWFKALFVCIITNTLGISVWLSIKTCVYIAIMRQKEKAPLSVTYAG